MPADQQLWDEPMRVAMQAAAVAAEAGDVPVGALVVGPTGELLATAGNAREVDQDPTAHAELLAIRQAAQRIGSWRLHGCTLVVTLEPCVMCAGAIVWARVDRIVFGAVDPKAGAVGSLYDVPADPRLNHRPEVVAGVLAAECGEQLRAFFAGRRDAHRAARQGGPGPIEDATGGGPVR